MKHAPKPGHTSDAHSFKLQFDKIQGAFAAAEPGLLDKLYVAIQEDCLDPDGLTGQFVYQIVSKYAAESTAQRAYFQRAYFQRVKEIATILARFEPQSGEFVADATHQDRGASGPRQAATSRINTPLPSTTTSRKHSKHGTRDAAWDDRFFVAQIKAIPVHDAASFLHMPLNLPGSW